MEEGLFSQWLMLTLQLTHLNFAGLLTPAICTFEINEAVRRKKYIFLFQAAAFSICASSSVVTLFHNDSVNIQTATRLLFSYSEKKTLNHNLDYLDICTITKYF